MSTRKFSRVGFRVDAAIRTAERTFRGEVQNLSMSGMFVVTDERLEPGTPVELSIILTGSSPEIIVAMSGTVSRAGEHGLGFSFERIGLESFTHLRNIVAYNSEDADKVMDDMQHPIDDKTATE